MACCAGVKYSAHDYMVVIAGICTGFLIWGVQQSFGAFLPVIIDTYDVSRSMASVIHSVLIAVSYIIGSLTGFIVKKWGSDKVMFVGSMLVSLGFIVSYFTHSLVMLYVSIGLIAGVGMSFTYITSVIVIGKVFTNRGRTAFLSLQNVGTGLGGIVLPYLIEWSLQVYTLNGSFLLIGGLLLNSFASDIIICYADTKHDTNSKDIKTVDKLTGKERIAYNGCVNVLSLIGITICMSNLLGIFVMLIDILNHKGLSSTESLTCLVAANLVGTCARFLPFLTETIFNQPLVTVIISSLVGLTGVLLFMFGATFSSLILGTICIGVCDGATISAVAPVVFHVVESDRQGLAYGVTMTAIGILASGVAPLYGGLFDLTSSYSTVLYISAITFGTSTLITSICLYLYNGHEKP